MKQITRDVSFTLTLKVFLLFMLWFICFRHENRVIEPAQWLGSIAKSPTTKPSLTIE